MRITSGKFKNKQVKTIDSDLIRPTLSKIRESIFNVLQNDIEGVKFLDLFSGSGIVGIEAASRNAKSVTFIEKNPKHYKLLKENLSAFDFEYKTFHADSIGMLEKFKENSFDIIFSDPPYKTNLNEQAVKIISEKKILTEKGWLIIECNKTENTDFIKKTTNFNIIKEKNYGDTKILYVKYK